MIKTLSKNLAVAKAKGGDTIKFRVLDNGDVHIYIREQAIAYEEEPEASCVLPPGDFAQILKVMQGELIR